jgi:hypothetical protein
MSKKVSTAVVLIVAFMFGVGVKRAASQDTPAAKLAPQAVEPGHAYRLDFTVSEVEDGKKINSRQYSMNVRGGEQDEIKIGTRVPVESKNGEFQYIDVGTTIWCRLRDRTDVTWLAGDVMLNLRAEISNFAVPDQQGQNVHPTLRQLKIEGSTIAIVGKPLVVGSVDDPNSRRQFQLEVTVNKLK